MLVSVGWLPDELCGACVEHSAPVMLSFPGVFPGQGIRVREHAACDWQGVLQLAWVLPVGPRRPQLHLSVTSREVSFPVAGLGRVYLVCSNWFLNLKFAGPRLGLLLPSFINTQNMGDLGESRFTGRLGVEAER